MSKTTEETPEEAPKKKGKKKEPEAVASPKADGSAQLSAVEEKLRKAEITRLKQVLGVTAGLTFADQYESVKEVLSTSHAELDRILTTDHFEKFGIGGIPRGYLVEVYGPFGGGKSSLCLMIAASATKKGQMVLWCDAESSYQPAWATAQGVDNSKLILARANTCANGEQWMEFIEKAAKTKAFSVIIVDSLVGLQPKAILECALEDNARMGAFGAMTSKAVPRLVTAAADGHTAIIFINQVRQKVGVVYGNPETTPGGEALKFLASLRIRVSPCGKSNRGITKDGEQIGVRSNIQNTKGRFGPPMLECILPIYFTTDVKPHAEDQLIDMAINCKLIKCRTEDNVQYFSFDDLKRVPGIDELKRLLDDDYKKKMAEMIKAKGGVLGPDIVEYLANLGKIVADDPLAEKLEPDTI